MSAPAAPDPSQNTLRRHVGRTLALAWPMILSRVGIVTMFTIDVVVLGRAGADELADYVIGQAINDSLVGMVIGLLMGVPVLVARETGAGIDGAAGRIWRRGLAFGVAVGLVLAAALQFAEALYLATGQEPGLAARAARVTGVVALALPCIAAYYVSASLLEALHRPGVALVAILIANAANLGLNLVLVFGLGPIPALGAVGCALASVLVFLGLAIGMAAYVLLVFPERARYGLAAGGRPGVAPPFATQARLGLASGASFFLEAAAFTVVTLIVGRLGALALAAHGVLFQFLALTFMVAYGIAGATQVRVGNAWGRKDPRGIAMAGWTGLAIAALLTAAGTATFASFPRTAIAAFTSDPAVAALAAPMMVWVALATVFDGGQSVMNNACRGRGDAWFPTMLHFGSYWLVMVPLAWALTFPAGQGLAGVYQAIWIASVVSLAALALRFRRLTRETP